VQVLSAVYRNFAYKQVDVLYAHRGCACGIGTACTPLSSHTVTVLLSLLCADLADTTRQQQLVAADVCLMPGPTAY
jgi:hypothetical protein